MKTNVTITEITKEDLVNLLSTASYGSNWLGLNYDSIEWETLVAETGIQEDCIEDKMAQLLLHGKSVELYDMYSEDSDDFYGELPHKYDEDGDMRYTVTLEDIKRGLEKAATSEIQFVRECFSSLMEEDAWNLDLESADALIQIILFGELTYG